MIRSAAALLVCLALTAPAAAGVADDAARAAADLQAAIVALDQAQGARDRVAALTQTIRAYEDGLAALRASLREADLRESQLSLQLAARDQDISRLLGVLAGLRADPGPMLLIHPTGPLGTVRSGMLMAEVTPALQAEAEALRLDLTELHILRDLHSDAALLLTSGLSAVQEARAALSQAISDRTDLPRRITEDPEALTALVDGAETLQAFAEGLTLEETDEAPFAAARGSLPLPVVGQVILRPGETDAAGVTRPGIVLATRPLALVTAPWSATIRYRGPLLDYGNVMILEPGGGYLLILAGLGTVYGEVGEVVEAGAPLGLMGGPDGDDLPATADLLAELQEGGGASGTESLYLELRMRAEPVDPTGWFAATGD